jgi:hypothetical protein
VYYWSICDRWHIFSLQSSVLFVVDDSFFSFISVWMIDLCLTTTLTLGGANGLSVGSAVVLQNFKTKTFN